MFLLSLTKNVLLTLQNWTCVLNTRATPRLPGLCRLPGPSLLCSLSQCSHHTADSCWAPAACQAPCKKSKTRDLPSGSSKPPDKTEGTWNFPIMVYVLAKLHTCITHHHVILTIFSLLPSCTCQRWGCLAYTLCPQLSLDPLCQTWYPHNPNFTNTSWIVTQQYYKKQFHVSVNASGQWSMYISTITLDLCNVL